MRIKNTRVMLYVEDVKVIRDFFVTTLQAEVVAENPLPHGYLNINLKVSEQLELGLFPKAFIAKYSPEVLGPVPSLMFFTEDFDALYEKLGEGREKMNDTFNFSDPEGNYYVMAKMPD
ncbi:glyoxalase [Leuconostoc lactis]|uniref:glyoxalase n=1 Tax=Leuconostoc lactis TaxID=1246 RepID=UPI00289655AE|nr:glyoxalase [Leuconostoc lactis]